MVLSVPSLRLSWWSWWRVVELKPSCSGASTGRLAPVAPIARGRRTRGRLRAVGSARVARGSAARVSECGSSSIGSVSNVSAPTVRRARKGTDP